jgi:hypothetical protein
LPFEAYRRRRRGSVDGELSFGYTDGEEAELARYA